MRPVSVLFFFFNDTATTEIYTLSLHDALPISAVGHGLLHRAEQRVAGQRAHGLGRRQLARRRVERVLHAAGHLALLRDRKSTRLNSSHANISYAVFCLKKKKKMENGRTPVATK